MSPALLEEEYANVLLVVFEMFFNPIRIKVNGMAGKAAIVFFPAILKIARDLIEPNFPNLARLQRCYEVRLFPDADILILRIGSR